MSSTSPNHKLLIYQLTIRLFGNKNKQVKPWGSLKENGTGTFSDVNETALKSLKKFGITHVWTMGVIEHATMEDFSELGIPKDHPAVIKGRAGSPYAIKDYYDVNPFLAENPTHRMAEFEAMVERVHKQKLKLIIDFVPNHVARQYHSDVKPTGVLDLGEGDLSGVAFSPENNFYYLPGEEFIIPEGVHVPVESVQPYHEYPAKATGDDVFSSRPNINHWYETTKLNYGVDYLKNRATHFDPIPNTWFKMRDILLFWASKGVDGFRCDMAEMVPVEFWGWCIPQVKAKYTVDFIAEIYNPAQYHNYIFNGKFDYLYDKVGLYDTLRALMEGRGNVADITRIWQQESGDIDQHMLRFLENHDEQRIASEFFARNPNYAIPAWVVSATMGRGPLMLFFGQEVGEPAADAEGFQTKDGRTTIFDWWAVPQWQKLMNEGKFDGGQLNAEEKQLYDFYAAVNKLCQKSEAVQTGHFYDLQYVNNWGQSPGYDDVHMYSYLRYTENQILLFVTNFHREESRTAEVRIPQHFWTLVGLNPEGNYQYKDLLLAKKVKGSFRATESISIQIPANGVFVFEITPQ
ncbi:alpha-amylase family protein [Siphonobacter sp. SORGH_AS_0500]|uniref:alpha-amylase family protein n=2 Tax=Siphonobacter sp. SORGH_AS_0500 TaxID=1864824 RepID=UPI002860DFEE|nr:alpha-amylase family protein [Siphonobacter sp. SORGH_AS_0500]MDR6195082.1 glycosidase [Siphonobacter sp. SORGH_AS_0500]